MSLYAKQQALEQEAIDIKKRKEYNDLVSAIKQGRFDETLQGHALMKTYFVPIRDKIQEYLDNPFEGKIGVVQRYLKLFTEDASLLAYLVLQVLLRELALRNNKGVPTRLSLNIMKSLRAQSTYDKVEEENPKLIAYLGHEFRRASRKRKNFLMNKHFEEFKDEENTKTKEMDLKAGAVLLELVLLSNLSLIEERRVWDKHATKHSVNTIAFTDEVFDVLTQSYNLSPTVASYPPMIVPPNDWVGFTQGGYLTVKHPFMKVYEKMSKKKILGENFDKPMKVINKLQQTAWRVNKRVYDVLNYVYNNNLIDPRSPPTLPRLYGDIPTSIPINIKDLIPPQKYIDNPTKEEKKAWAIWNKNREQVQVKLDAEQGRRIQYVMTMAMVHKMVEYDRFYYAYQLDYRGRVYPITDFFTPQSKGYVKSMLEFGNGHYLTEVGVFWLKVHIANCAGYDKIPLQERVDWVDATKLRLLKIATDPLSNLADWVYTDSPYEYLAGCFAYEDYIQGKPVHLPIQLDAVNSGIQMYSGLLRDKQGAESTCVIGQVRSDLYKEVAERVEHKLQIGEYPPYITFTDKEGKERVSHTKIEANSLKGNFTRSMTKPNVMTLPYSVTHKGMTDQNWVLMEDIKLKGKQFWEGDEWVVNKIWTQLTADSIHEIVKGARRGQEYLKEVAKVLKDVALWHTPIYDLPVIQPAYQFDEIRVRTVLGRLSLREAKDEVKRSKQLSAIAANYIHSIDATILMYVVEHISGDIGTIHDCFLVHPNLGEEVRDCYKDGYVKVMKSDPLQKFSKELDPDGLVEIPYVGDLDLDDVYNSEYIIS